MSLFEERQKRINDSIALQEPDRVPITAYGQCYPVINAGYTTADALYDFDVYAESMIKFLKDYEPDCSGPAITTAGQGPLMELFQPKTIAWPGAPDARIDKNSIHQFIEFSVLQEEDMQFFMQDYTGWLLTKAYPAVSGLLEPFAGIDFAAHKLDTFPITFVSMLSTPAAKEMMQTIWKLGDMFAELGKKNMELGKKYAELGFPSPIAARLLVPFDAYSDFHRGTLDAMMDLYEHPEVIQHFIDMHMEKVLQAIVRIGGMAPGKWLFMPLHKGMDSFLTDEQYKTYYWPYLQKMINKIIEVGMVPYVYTEGPYNSRIKYLADVPKGKVVYHFEEADPVEVKKVLGDVACVSGFFPSYLLHYGKKQQCIDEAKRLIDILAPGGGYMLNATAAFDNAIPENIEAMFDTVKTYGAK